MISTRSSWRKSLDLDSLCRRVVASWNAIHNDPPKILFHYTTAGGLLGILKASEIWATHVRYLNDTMEWLHSMTLIRQIIEQRRGASDGTLVRNLHDGILICLDIHNTEIPYAACFCEDGDLLSQWNAYAGRGGGYAIGLESRSLDPKQVPRAVLTDWPLCDYRLRKVVYELDEQRRLIADCLDQMVGFLDRKAASSTEEEASRDLPECIHLASDLLLDMASWFKHPAFRSEAEWRLISWQPHIRLDPSKPRLYRESNGHVVPYVTVPIVTRAGVGLGKAPARLVTIGPRLDAELARKSLEMFLMQYHYEFTDIETSGVPLSRHFY